MLLPHALTATAVEVHPDHVVVILPDGQSVSWPRELLSETPVLSSTIELVPKEDSALDSIRPHLARAVLQEWLRAR